jgi:hypothetical protein
MEIGQVARQEILVHDGNGMIFKRSSNAASADKTIYFGDLD